MWHSYWLSNKKINILVDCFVSARECIITNNSSLWCISSVTSAFSFFYLRHLFVYSIRPFLCDPFFDITCIIAHTYSFCNILQKYDIFFAVRTVLVLFSLYNLYSGAHIYHSCSTFPWFDVHITTSMILFLRFDLIAHSFYCTCLIACPNLFW